MKSAARSQSADAPFKPGLKLRLKAKLGMIGELRLVTYLSHGTHDFLHVKGRLIEAAGEGGGVSEEGTLLHNVITTLHRMESDEIAGARLAARFRQREYDVYTDHEGFFQLNLYPEDPLEAGWHAVELELIDSIEENAQATATAQVLVPPMRSEFAILSDIDDTVIESSATDKLEQVRVTLFRNARTRIATPGIPALYGALVRGPDGKGANPVFYVSRSGWNLYDLFAEFFETNGIPSGPMYLRDLAFREDKSTTLGSKRHHKLEQIRELLQTYPRLPFILIGDSGQGDARDYRQIALEHPGRVRAVYLRDVTDADRDSKVKTIAADLNRRGVAAMVAADGHAFAEHMRSEGLIAAAEDLEH